MALGTGSVGTGLAAPVRSMGGKRPLALGGSSFTSRPQQTMMLNRAAPGSGTAGPTPTNPAIGAEGAPPYPGQLPGYGQSYNTQQPFDAGAYQQQMQQYYNALMGTVNAQTTGQNSLLGLQQEFAKQQYDWSKANAQGNYNYESQLLNSAAGRAGLDVNMSELDQAKLNAQGNYYTQQGNIGQQRFNTNDAAMQQYLQANDQQYQADLGFIAQQHGFNSREYEIAKKQLDAQYGYSGEQRGFEEQQAQLAYDQQTRLALSDAIGRGAGGSKGLLDTYSELGRGKDIAFGQAGLGYRQRGTDLDAASGRARLGFDVTGAGLEKQRTDTGIQYGVDKTRLETDRSNLGYDYQDFQNQLGTNQEQLQYDQRQAYLRTKQLQSIADDYGIKKEQLEFALQSAFDKMGMDAHQAIAQLSQMMASNDSNQQAQANALIAQILGVQGAT